MMNKVKVGVVGYGTIGQRLADGVVRMGDMELVGVANRTPNLGVRALKEKGMPYDLYMSDPKYADAYAEAGIPVCGTMEDLAEKCDILLDATPAGVGAENKKLFERMGKPCIFQGGEKNDVADVFFHGYANYEKGLDKQFLKLTSCNTTGLIRAVDCLDRNCGGIERVAITIIRRVADPGDYHRGLTNALKIDKAPSHQAVDLMTIMPHVEATGILVHTPVTHGHIITITAQGKQKITKEQALEAFKTHDRIRVVRIADGFLGNASNPRGDMYEIGLWEESIVEYGDQIMFAIYIPQEAVTIPETLDGVRAALHMQDTMEEATAKTNEYLGMAKWK